MPLDLPDHLERMLTRLKLTAIRDQLDSLIDGEVDQAAFQWKAVPPNGRRELTIREALTLCLASARSPARTSVGSR